jgi:hypothetical protein
MLERLARDKHSAHYKNSLIAVLKSFISLGPELKVYLKDNMIVH